MKQSVKIIGGRRGWYLQVNGMYIHRGFDGDIKALQCNDGIPYKTTEWASITAIRKFWHENMPVILWQTTRPVKSEWGQLISIK